MDEPSDFLDEIRRACTLEDRSRALATAREVFHVLLRAGDQETCRAVAALLPEELETVWKPAFFTSLREGPGAAEDAGEAAYVHRLREEVDGFEEDDEARRAVRSVLRALRRRMDAGRQAELGRTLPATLRETWTSA